MATSRDMRICELLFFCSNKYGELNEKCLNDLIYNFYLSADIKKAKEILINDIDELNLDNWPKPGRHGNSDTRVREDVADIVRMYEYLDRNNLFDQMPTYVAKDMVNIPMMKLEDGDVRAFMCKMDKVESITLEVKNLISDWRTSSSSSDQFLLHGVNMNFESSSNNPVSGISDQGIQPLASSIEEGRFINRIIDAVRSRDHSRAGTSDEEGYDVAMSKRSKKRKLLASQQMRRSPDVNLNSDKISFQNANSTESFSVDPVLADPSTPGPGSYRYRLLMPGISKQITNPRTNNQRSNRPRLFGACKDDLGIKAAGSLIKKNFFYVGNLAENIKDRDLQNFLESRNIPVLKCTSTQSKFRGSAFHVAVASKHAAAFRDVNMWPENVVIHDWFFKNKNASTVNNPSSDNAVILPANNNIIYKPLSDVEASNNRMNSVSESSDSSRATIIVDNNGSPN